MNSIFANLHNHIIDRFAAVIPEEDVRYIDLDLSQLESYDPSAGGKPPVSWNCVLIDMENFNFTDEGELQQRAEGIVTMR